MHNDDEVINLLKTNIEFKNGKPFISVNGELRYPFAYTTYFEECGSFEKFIEHGYKIFFINISFTGSAINTSTNFSPFYTGVFETATPDYTEFENVVSRILEKCPDALIFPRINISMPKKWINKNISETVETPSGNRESLYSQKFLNDGAELLREMILHIRNSDYAESIAGYHVCGGLTQEWMHFDFFGSFSEMGIKKFYEWQKENYNTKHIKPITKKDFEKKRFNENAFLYGEFCSKMTAKTVEHFAKVVKECVNNEQIVGTFYGYNAFVNDILLGLHGLRFIIDSPYIDFFSSPCAYDNNRALGIDWGDMIANESLKIHNKLYFVECDVRTHLTKRMQESRPGKYPDDIYTPEDKNGNKTAWCGPPTKELSLSAIRKAYIHQLTKGSGVWWFDMWGGWYEDDAIMKDLEKMKDIADSSVNKNTANYPQAETVLFIDEKAYLNNPRKSDFCHSVNRIRTEMGNTGIPFDLCMVEDADKVLHKYKAAIFPAVLPSKWGSYALELCKRLNIPHLQADTKKYDFNKAELREFLTKNGVHCYNNEDNVIYCGNGFLGIHSAMDGQVKIALPKTFCVKPLFGTEFKEETTNTIVLNMKKYDTAIFELD